MDRKRFEREAGDLDSGFYVNVQFSLAPDKVEPLRAKLALNDIVYRQFYLKQEAVAACLGARPRRPWPPTSTKFS